MTRHVGTNRRFPVVGRANSTGEISRTQSTLRLKVVAEGVETEDQAKILRLLRCDEMQGYLISRPVPEIELQDILRRQTQ